MLLLDLNNDVLLDILSFVDPVDLFSILNVCQRLRNLAEWTINNTVLRINLTGIHCFPNLKSKPINNLDRIRVYKSWLDGEFTRIERLTNYKNVFCQSGIILDENLYVAERGAIRKFYRLWKSKYLKKSRFEIFGDRMDPEITTIAKKHNEIFISCLDHTCIIYQDKKPIKDRLIIPGRCVVDLDLFPKNNIYVTAYFQSVNIWIKSLNDRTLTLEDEICKSSNCVKIDPTGEKLITGDKVTLYDFRTKTKEDHHELDGVWSLLWRNNQTFFSGHEDGSLKLFDLRTKSVCQRIDPLTKDKNCSIQFDGQNAVLCGFRNSKAINICDLRMNKVLKQLQIFNKEEPYTTQLLQVVADPKHLFAVTTMGMQICHFSD